ncbi:hypothetical protein DIPPA_28596 [Diplonema papillatum]|nr:hypothetical protein DIPPA_28596 [Diplonema papillatum]
MKKRSNWLDDAGVMYVERQRDEEVSHGDDEGVHVVVVVTFVDPPCGWKKTKRKAAAAKGGKGTVHPYLSSMPAEVQQHFNPRKMDRDRWELPYEDGDGANRWWCDAAEEERAQGDRRWREKQAKFSGLAREIAKQASAYVFPVAVEQADPGNDGLVALGRRLFVRVQDFLLRLREARVHLSFVAAGIGGLVAKSSLGWFRRDTSALALSGIRVALRSFVGMSCPFLGLRRSPALGNAWKWWRHYRLVRRYGLLGKELLCEDADFALMGLCLHDGRPARAFTEFVTVRYFGIAGDSDTPDASSLSLADPRVTPLGKYVALCRRDQPDAAGRDTTNQLPPHLADPDATAPPAYSQDEPDSLLPTITGCSRWAAEVLQGPRAFLGKAAQAPSAHPGSDSGVGVEARVELLTKPVCRSRRRPAARETTASGGCDRAAAGEPVAVPRVTLVGVRAWVVEWALETIYGPPCAALALVSLAHGLFPPLRASMRAGEAVAGYGAATAAYRAFLAFAWLAAFALLLCSGYAYGGYAAEAPETLYGHLGDPMAAGTFYKAAHRAFADAPAGGARGELCVNVVKEVLNTPEPRGVVRRLLSPVRFVPFYAWSVRSALESPEYFTLAAAHLQLDARVPLGD